ncbi:MAG: hypothetical protein RIC56_15955 [Pseudomonadales bacterium]
MARTNQTIGLVPMGGSALRLSPLPCSKEVLPLGLTLDPGGRRAPKGLVHYLLDHYRAAGIDSAVLVIGAHKWDIADYLTRSVPGDVDVAFVGINQSQGVPFSVDRAYPWIRHATCAFGLPDILLPLDDPFGPLLRALRDGSADVVLGLFPAEEPERVDLVETDADGLVTRLEPKPRSAAAGGLTWSVAVWTPRFSDFVHDLLRPAWDSADGLQALLATTEHTELFLGDVFNHARHAGLEVRGVQLSDQPSLDVGTPQAYIRAWQSLVEAERSR